jgi:hypothetical protein
LSVSVFSFDVEGQGFSMVAIRKQKREQKLGYGIMKKRYWEIFWFYFPRLIGTGTFLVIFS